MKCIHQVVNFSGPKWTWKMLVRAENGNFRQWILMNQWESNRSFWLHFQKWIESASCFILDICNRNVSSAIQCRFFIGIFFFIDYCVTPIVSPFLIVKNESSLYSSIFFTSCILFNKLFSQMLTTALFYYDLLKSMSHVGLKRNDH